MELNTNISEAPKDGTKILVLTERGHWFVVKFDQDYYRWEGRKEITGGLIQDREIIFWSHIPQEANLSKVISNFFLFSS